MGIFNGKWPFYISGLTLIFAFLLGLYLLDDTLGMGDSVSMISQYSQEAIESEDFQQSISFDYSLGIIIGLILGAFVAAVGSRNYKIQLLGKFDGGLTINTFKTIFYGIVGGFMVMLGVQIAGESILGQMISAMQMSLGAWIFLISLALSGGILAILLEHGNKINKE